jgi:hypothetical protein
VRAGERLVLILLATVAVVGLAGCSSRGGALNPPNTDSPPATGDTPAATAQAELVPTVVSVPVPEVVVPTVPETPPPLEPAGPDAAAAGAPFDPCTIVSWADFPASVRADDPRNVPTVMEVVAQRAEVEVAHGGQPGESGVDPARAV